MSAYTLTCTAINDSYNTTPWRLTLDNTPTNNKDRCLTLTRFHRSSFTWNEAGIIVSEGDPEEDPDAFTVPVNGPAVERKQWRFTCVSVCAPPKG